LKNVKDEEAIVMETASVNPLYLVILLMLFWLGFFVIPSLMLRRAISQVIRIFRRNHSLCSESPKTVGELGLAPQGLMDRLFKPRDYKPYALQFLARAGAVRQTEDGKLCLVEEKLGHISRQ
jgi:hypothetical protein